MASFDLAIPVILAHEGTPTNFWVDDPVDAGGETVWGISMLLIRSLRLSPRDLGLDQDEFTPGCLKTVSKNVCAKIYKLKWWDPMHLGDLDDQNVATKVMDMTVNAGPHNGGLLVQQAAKNLGADLVIDGIVGSGTVAALNSIDADMLLTELCRVSHDYYAAIIARRPNQAKFAKAWYGRAAWRG